MSTMSESAPTPKSRRVRRQFTDEFRAGAVRLVIDEHRSIAQVSREPDLTESALRLWVDRARADRGKGRSGVLTTAEREELVRLRKENRELRMDRDILKKAAVDSGGRRNAGRQPISPCLITKRLSRTHVKASRHRVEVRLCVGRQVDAVREVLPQEPVRVLARAALPRTLRIAEVDLDVRGHREGLVCGQLHAAIPRE